MPSVLIIIKRFFDYIRRERLHRIFMCVLAVIFLGSVAFAFVEKNMSILGAIWWAVVTVTTVGYGDITPSTLAGKLIGVVIMFLGIGLTGVLTATLAGFFIEERTMKKKGMREVEEREHFIICGWNVRGQEIYRELRGDLKIVNKKIVLIADMAESPQPEDPYFYFVKGEPDKDTLKKANAQHADTIIVLLDENLGPYARDAKAVLNTLTIKSLYPDRYVCVEIGDSSNVRHLKNAGADEIIVAGEISSKLLVQAALDHGVTELISELLSTRYGNEFYLVNVPNNLVGKTFFDAVIYMKRNEDILAIGVKDSDRNLYLSNPPSDFVLKEKDKLVVIAKNRPVFQ